MKWRIVIKHNAKPGVDILMEANDTAYHAVQTRTTFSRAFLSTREDFIPDLSRDPTMTPQICFPVSDKPPLPLADLSHAFADAALSNWPTPNSKEADLSEADFGYCLVAGCEPLVLKLVDA
jgi:hypothetical protein